MKRRQSAAEEPLHAHPVTQTTKPDAYLLLWSANSGQEGARYVRSVSSNAPSTCCTQMAHGHMQMVPLCCMAVAEQVRAMLGARTLLPSQNACETMTSSTANLVWKRHAGVRMPTDGQ